MGLRFLYPVYLIDSVEVTLGDQTSDATMTKSILCNLLHTLCTSYSYAHTAKGFLQSVGKTSFVRAPGGYPRKLTEQEALDMQMRTQLKFNY